MLWTRGWIQSSALCNVNNTLLNLMLHINTVYTVLVNALFFSLGKFVFKACTRSCLIGNTWKYGTLFILNTDILFLYYFKLKNKTVLPALYLCLQSQIVLFVISKKCTVCFYSNISTKNMKYICCHFSLNLSCFILLQLQEQYLINLDIF